MSLDTWLYTTKRNDQAWDSNEYKVMNASPSGEGTISAESTTFTFTYMVEYDNVDHFVDDVLGYSIVQGTSSSATMSRVLPEQHPFVSTAYAVRASFRTAGIPLEVFQWNKAVVDVVFDVVDYPVLSDSEITSELQRFVSIKVKSKTEFLSVQGFLKFVDGGSPPLPLNAQPGFLVPSQIIEMVWRRLPESPAGGIALSPLQIRVNQSLGHVNVAPFLQYKRGQVLFLDADSKLSFPTLESGTQFWDQTLTFAVRYGDNTVGSGWNQFFNTTANQWMVVTTTGLAGGTKIYQDDIDFNQTFSAFQLLAGS